MRLCGSARRPLPPSVKEASARPTIRETIVSRNSTYVVMCNLYILNKLFCLLCTSPNILINLPALPATLAVYFPLFCAALLYLPPPDPVSGR